MFYIDYNQYRESTGRYTLNSKLFSLRVNTNSSTMNSLPDELLVHVIGVGDVKTAVTLGSASRRSRSLAHGDGVSRPSC